MSKIGHNKPPKDREINHKSISINVWSYKDLERIRDYIQMKRDAFLDNPLKQKKVTIPMAIEIMSAEYWLDHIMPYECEKLKGFDMYKDLIKINKHNEKKKQRR